MPLGCLKKAISFSGANMHHQRRRRTSFRLITSGERPKLSGWKDNSLFWRHPRCWGSCKNQTVAGWSAVTVVLEASDFEILLEAPPKHQTINELLDNKSSLGERSHPRKTPQRNSQKSSVPNGPTKSPDKGLTPFSRWEKLQTYFLVQKRIGNALHLLQGRGWRRNIWRRGARRRWWLQRRRRVIWKYYMKAWYYLILLENITIIRQLKSGSLGNWSKH